MTRTIEEKICDVCKRKTKAFAGSLTLKYSDSDYMGNGFLVKIERKEICIDCCRKLEKVIGEVLKEIEQ